MGKRDTGEPVIPTKVTFTAAADDLTAERMRSMAANLK
jgi:hypothetical protein